MVQIRKNKLNFNIICLLDGEKGENDGKDENAE